MGGVGIPLGDLGPGEGTEASAPHGGSPTAVTELGRMDRLHVSCYVHLEDFRDDLRPRRQLAAHPAQGTPAGFFQVSLDLMRWTFSFPYGQSAQATLGSVRARKQFWFNCGNVHKSQKVVSILKKEFHIKIKFFFITTQ